MSIGDWVRILQDSLKGKEELFGKAGIIVARHGPTWIIRFSKPVELVDSYTISLHERKFYESELELIPEPIEELIDLYYSKRNRP